jgi:AAA15 family ATPase/GTPase
MSRAYFLKSLTFSGYRKFGVQSQTVEVAYPDFKTPGSGLNIIVGGIGSGKSSLLELIWLNAGNGLDDNDKLVINTVPRPVQIKTIRSPV